MPTTALSRTPVVQAGEQVGRSLVLPVALSLLAGAYTMRNDGLAVVPLSIACLVLGVWVTLEVQTARATERTQQQEMSANDSPN